MVILKTMLWKKQTKQKTMLWVCFNQPKEKYRNWSIWWWKARFPDTGNLNIFRETRAILLCIIINQAMLSSSKAGKYGEWDILKEQNGGVLQTWFLNMMAATDGKRRMAIRKTPTARMAWGVLGRDVLSSVLLPWVGVVSCCSEGRKEVFYIRKTQ